MIVKLCVAYLDCFLCKLLFLALHSLSLVSFFQLSDALDVVIIEGDEIVEGLLLKRRLNLDLHIVFSCLADHSFD